MGPANKFAGWFEVCIQLTDKIPAPPRAGTCFLLRSRNDSESR